MANRPSRVVPLPRLRLCPSPLAQLHAHPSIHPSSSSSSSAIHAAYPPPLASSRGSPTANAWRENSRPLARQLRMAVCQAQPEHAEHTEIADTPFLATLWDFKRMGEGGFGCGRASMSTSKLAPAAASTLDSQLCLSCFGELCGRHPCGWNTATGQQAEICRLRDS